MEEEGVLLLLMFQLNIERLVLPAAPRYQTKLSGQLQLLREGPAAQPCLQQ
jgi:hypothetical protein